MATRNNHERIVHLPRLCFIYPVFLAQAARSIRSDRLQILVLLYFNTEENLYYVGSIPDVLKNGFSEMSDSERRQFLEWYDGQKSEVFDNRSVLESYCQDDVTDLRQACQVFSREFIQIGNIHVFLEAITIASACNKLLRKRFLISNTIGLIPTGGYSGNVKYSKKSMVWHLYKENTGGLKILHARNCREYRLP
jgi:hypothetical protein